MEMVRERTQENERVISKEEQEHNAMIRERYNKLKNAVEGQFAEKNVENTVRASVYTPNVSAPTYGYTPVVEQNPQVTEYIRNLRETIFSTEVFNGVNTSSQVESAIVEEPVVENVVNNANETETTVKESYCFTTFAKVSMAIFAVVVVALMALISVNTNIIEQKDLRVRELQAQKQELIEQNIAVERRIDEAKSDEVIREYAESQGMIQIG